MNLGPLEIGLIILAVLLLFGYKKLPDASRSIGYSAWASRSRLLWLPTATRRVTPLT